MSEEICKTCGRPILEDEGRYTLGEFQDPPVYQHYKCYVGQREAYKGSLVRFAPRARRSPAFTPSANFACAPALTISEERR